MEAAWPELTQKRERKMRRLCLAGMMLLCCGCQNVSGPFRPKPPIRVDDPSVTIDEQERRGRSRLALPVESSNVGPYTGGGGGTLKTGTTPSQ